MLTASCAFCAAFALTFPAPAHAQTVPSPAPSPSGLPVIGRVVTSDRRAEPLDRTSRPTYVIDRAQMDAIGARSVADALATIPGVTLYRYGAYGALTSYGLRGASSEQTLVLLDGIPIAAATTGSVDLASFPIGSVRRIEVVESGASTLYGTSAVGGVINIITGAPRGTDVLLADGSYGDRDARVSSGDGPFSASFERHVATNAYSYSALQYPEVTFPAGVRYNDWANQSDGRFTFAQTYGTSFSVRAGAGFDAVHIGVPGELDFPSIAAVQRTQRADANLELAYASGRSTLSLTVSGAHQDLVYDDPAYGGESDTYDGRSQVSLKDVLTLGRSTLVTGIDLSRESAAISLGPDGPPPNFGASQSQSAAYVQDQIDVGSAAQATFGLRGENDAPHGGVLAPAFGALFHAGDLRIAGNVSESFRVPTLDDLYYPGFSNPKLVPEKSGNEDVTLSLPSAGGGVSLGWFGRAGSNFIELDDNYVPQNVQRASVAGLIATAATRPYHGLIVNVSVTDVYKALDVATGDRLARNPVMQATLGFMHPFGRGRTEFGVNARIVGGDGDESFGAGPFAYDGYTTLDAYVRYKIARDAILTLRSRNFGDEHYAAVAGYPAAGRTFSLELSTR
jgi:vitamin B12 transporter